MERPQLPERLRNRRNGETKPEPADSTAGAAMRMPAPKFPAPKSFPPLPSSPASKVKPPVKSPEPAELPPEIPAAIEEELPTPEPVRANINEPSALPSLSAEDDGEAVNFLKMRTNNKKAVAQKEIKRWKKRAIVASISAVLPALAVFGLFEFNTIPSHSMSPTVGYDDLVVSFRFGSTEPKTGDIVVFSGEGTDWGDSMFLKRVIGVSGDNVSCCETDKILLNEETLDEEYLMSPDKPASSVGFNVEVEEDSFFALGDNRNSSKDSRYFFTQSVPSENIVSKPFLGINFSEFRAYLI